MGYRKICIYFVCFIHCPMTAMCEEILQEFSLRNIPSSKTASSELHEACENGDFPLVVKILSMILPPDLCQSFNKYEFSDYLNVTVNLKNQKNEAPIHTAIRSGNSEIVKYLLEHHARIDMPDHHRNTPLHLAVRCRNLEMITILITYGAGINKQNCYGNTPLHVACACRHEDINAHEKWKTSLKYNLPIQEPDLIREREGKLLDILEILINAGAKIYIKNSFKRTPLMNVLDDNISLNILFTKSFFTPQCLQQEHSHENDYQTNIPSLKELCFQRCALSPFFDQPILPQELNRDFYEYLEPNLKIEKDDQFFRDKKCIEIMCERHFERFKFLLLSERDKQHSFICLFADMLMNTQSFDELPKKIKEAVKKNILQSSHLRTK